MGTERTALNLIKKWEGLHKIGKDGLIYAYLCPALVPTIGYGTVVPSIHFGPITREVAEQLCLVDVERSKKVALAMSPILSKHPVKLDAICSFIYNLGQARYGQSTLRRKINEGDFQAAAFEINRWVWAGGRKLPGLIARRYEESQWLLQD